MLGKPAGEDRARLDGAIEAGEHRFAARIYYADTDMSGAVYHGRYLELFERGRSDFLRCLGISHTELLARTPPIYWVVRRMEIDYLGAARIDDVVDVATQPRQVAGARVVMAQTIARRGRPLVRAVVTAALVDANGRPQRLPAPWRAAFRQVEEAAIDQARPRSGVP